MSFKGELIFDGIPEEEGESNDNCAEKVTEEILHHIGLQLRETSVQKCHRMGRLPKPTAGGPRRTRPRGILTKFSWQRDRDYIWDNRRKFKKDEENAHPNIWVNEHYPREIQLKRNELQPVLSLLKKSDKYRKISSLVGDRLIVDGEGYTCDDFDRLPDDIDVQSLYTQTEGGVTYFFRKRSPLSNHHPAPFDIGGVVYSCSEQYYYAEMAKACGATKVLGDVMSTPDPAAQKDAAKKIRKKSVTWKEKEYQTMKEAVRQKVLQNTHVKEFLLATGDTTLAECNPGDAKWGIAKRINDPTRADQDSWGLNQLGVILAEIRSEISQQ